MLVVCLLIAIISPAVMIVTDNAVALWQAGRQHNATERWLARWIGRPVAAAANLARRNVHRIRNARSSSVGQHPGRG